MVVLKSLRITPPPPPLAVRVLFTRHRAVAFMACSYSWCPFREISSEAAACALFSRLGRARLRHLRPNIGRSHAPQGVPSMRQHSSPEPRPKATVERGLPRSAPDPGWVRRTWCSVSPPWRIQLKGRPARLPERSDHVRPFSAAFLPSSQFFMSVLSLTAVLFCNSTSSL